LIRSIAASISCRSPVRRPRSNISRTSIKARISGGTGGGGVAVIARSYVRMVPETRPSAEGCRISDSDPDRLLIPARVLLNVSR
jgi:hypothetical protein